MSRRLAFVVLGIVGVAAGFVAGATTAAVRGWGGRDVVVDVVNESGQRVLSVALDIESCGVRNALARGPLEQGERATFRFTVCGEGGYRLRAQLEGGRELASGEGYVESGYRASERLRPTGIVSTAATLSY